jgi:hypothetical protein
MDYGSSPEGGYGIGAFADIGASTAHVDATDAGRVDIADAELLFCGHFARSGPDLILTGQDGHRLVVTGYFTSEKHPDLVAPNGAHLTGDVVDLLAGSPTHGQYAQAGTALPPEAIGRVEKVVGQVTLIHNGVAGPLHVGDPVYKTDVVQTGANSSCGIGFPDGTALDLVNNTRMALNDYNYQGDSASNGAVFSLVQGTFAFVAGKVAHTGEGMKINTPVATMGIRGTVGLFRSEPTVVNANLGHVWSVFLHEDIDGSHHLGRIALIDQDPTSPTFGETFYLLDSSEYIAYLEPQGPGLPPHVRLEPITNSKMFDDRHFYDDLGQVLTAFQNGTVNPQSVPGTPGSGDNPGLILDPLDLFLENGGRPLFNFVPDAPGNGPTQPPFPPGFSPLVPFQPGQIPNNNPPPNGPTNGLTNIFIWTGGNGIWDSGPSWTPGTSPGSPNDIVQIPTGTVTYNNIFTIGTLIIGPNGTLDIVGGSLTVLNGVTDNGTILVEGDPPALLINGPVTIGSSGSFTATGKGDEIEFANGTVDSHGTITALNQGVVLFQSELVTNEAGAKIATDHGFITFAGGGVTNLGMIDAKDHGVITFESISGNPIDVSNAAGGTIEAEDRAHIEFVGGSSGGQVDNKSGTIEATHHGVITFSDIAVTNEAGGLIEADNGGTVVFKNVAGDANGGLFNFGIIAAVGCGSEVDFHHTDINGGTLKADGGTIFVSSDSSFAGVVNILISGGGLANLANTVSDTGVAVTFSGVGTLELAHSLGGAFAGTVAGFGAGDAIVLDDLAFAKGEYAVWCNGTLTIYDCGVALETIAVSGSYGKNSFAIVDDGGKAEVVFATNEWIGPSPSDRTGLWTTASNWGDDLVPNSALNAVVDLPGKYTITTSGDQAANSLTITDRGATLTGAGTLSLSTLENHGKIKVTDGDKLVIDIAGNSENLGQVAAAAGTLILDGTTETTGGPQLTNGGSLIARHGGKFAVEHILLVNGTANSDSQTSAEIEATGRGSVVKFTGGSVLENYGLVLASDHGRIKFDGTSVTNEALPLGEGALGETTSAPGKIEAAGRGSVVSFADGASLDNLGVVEASDHGKVSFRGSSIKNEDGGDIYASDGGSVLFGRSYVDNRNGAAIDADGCGSEIKFHHSNVHNSGQIEATDNGTVTFDRSRVDNGRRGTIDSTGSGSSVQFFGSKVDNWGSIAAALGGLVLLEYSTISNAHGATIDADGCGSQVTFDHDRISNSGAMGAAEHGSVLFESSFVTNERHGTIEATGWSSDVTFEHTYVRNFGSIEAAYGGVISVECSTIDNWGGRIEAFGRGAAVDLDHAVIVGGTLETKSGGLIQTVSGTSTLDDVTIVDNSHVDVDRGTTLTLSGGTAMFGGTLDIGHCATLDIESSAGATLDDVNVLNHGTIEIDRPHERTTLVLENGTTIRGGGLSIGDHGELAIEGGRAGGATLDDVDVANGGEIAIGAPHERTMLALENGTTIHGGELSIADHSELAIEGGRSGGATLDGVDVANDGTIRVDDSAPATLYLSDGTTIHGGALSIGYDGAVDIESRKGATLDDVSVWNNGTITFGAAPEGGHIGSDPDLFIAGTVTLQGTGDLVLNGSSDNILGARSGGELDNDSNIVGAGHIGDGSDSLTLVNESCGIIDANDRGQTLGLDTGHHAIVNDGLLEASNGGTLLVESTLDNSCGSIAVCSDATVDLKGLVLGGSATIDGGTLIYTAAWDVNTTFADNTPDETSTLVLKGTGLSFITDAISGFSHGDVIDLADIAYNASTSFKIWGDLLTVYDNGPFGPSITIQLDGNYNASNIVLSSDGNIGTEITFKSSLLITGTETTGDSYRTTSQHYGPEEVRGSVAGDISFDDPSDGHVSATYSPDGKSYVGTFHLDTASENNGTGSVDWSFDFSNVALAPGKTLTQSYDVTLTGQHDSTATQQISVSIGGPGNDTFVFNPGVGADTIVNFNAHADHIDLEHFANINNYQELTEAVTADAHGNAVIELGHGDSITVAGLSENALKANLHSLVHLA